MTPTAPPQPKEGLAQLEHWLGSQHAVARVLGKPHAQVWKWLHGDVRIHGRNRRLINDTWIAVYLLVERVGAKENLEGWLDVRWPELDYRRPTDLIRENQVDLLVSAFRRNITPEVEKPVERRADEVLYAGVLRALREGRLKAGPPDRCSDDVDAMVTRFEQLEAPSEEEMELFAEEPAREEVTRGPFRATPDVRR